MQSVHLCVCVWDGSLGVRSARWNAVYVLCEWVGGWVS